MIDNALLAQILFVHAGAVLSLFLLRRKSRILARQQVVRCLRAVFRPASSDPLQHPENSSRSIDFGAKANLRRATLSRIPSIFGRLAYLASLRDPATGEYQHWGMSEIYGREEANKAIRQSHAEAFGEWLSLEAAGREADFGLYRSGLEAEGFDPLETVARLAPYPHLLPDSAEPAESKVFQSALIAHLDKLRHESAVPLSATCA